MLEPRPAADRRPDHPPGHADLRHARARLQVDARRREGRRREPAPRRADHQRAPGRLAQLPAQPRVQPLVHDRHRARLEARPRGHARRAGASCRRRVGAPAADAEALQDPHGPGDGGRHRTRSPGRRGRRRRASSSRRALRRLRHRRDPRAAGRHAGHPRALRSRPPTRSASRERLLEHLEGMQERGLLRRVAAILFHRRAGFSRQRHGRLEGARGPDHRGRPADGRLPRHLALLPAPDLRGLAVLGLHDGPRPLEGGVRRDPRLDRRGHRHPRARDALLVDRVQEDPPPVLHRRVQESGKRSTRRRGRSLAPRALRSGRSSCCRAASTRRCGRCARSAATRSSSSAARAPS